jgi:Zn-dependent protease with chaperone function
VIAPLLLVPLGAAFVALGLASGWTVGAAARLAARWTPSTWRRAPTALRAAVGFAPAILAALGSAALAFPNPFAGCHCASHGLHHPHLCTTHPIFALPLVMPAACLLGGWFMITARGVFRLVRDTIASARWARLVRCLPVERVDSVALRLADCGARSAFTIGALSPVIVFDRLLWRSLSEEERRAIAHHERGHIERRDGLTLLALRLCFALFPMPAGGRLLEAWRTAAEQACDRHAAAKLGNPAAVAAALVSVEKIRARSQDESAIPAHALGVHAGGDLARRVLALIENDEVRDTEPLLANDALAVAIVAFGALLPTIAWPGDAVHHAIETLIGHLVR